MLRYEINEQPRRGQRGYVEFFARESLSPGPHLWRERRAGELLILSRESGERVGFDGASESSSKARLEDLGLSKHESSRFQKLAAVPADDFEQAIDDTASEGR